MKTIIPFVSIAALSFSHSLSAIDAVFDAAVSGDLVWSYDSFGFEAFDDQFNEDIFGIPYDNQADFLAQNPVFDHVQGDTFVTGFARLTYEILGLAIDPSFDVNETYNWTVTGLLDYSYDLLRSNQAFESDWGTLGDTIEFQASASQFQSLSSSGETKSLFSNINLLTGVGLPEWSLLEDVLYDSSLGDPTGSVQFIATEPIPGIEYSAGDAFGGLYIQATRPVPDAGSTGLLALAGFGALIAARRRFRD